MANSRNNVRKSKPKAAQRRRNQSLGSRRYQESQRIDRANQALLNQCRDLRVRLARVSVDHHVHVENEASQPIVRPESQTLGMHSSFKCVRFDVNLGDRNIPLKLFYRCWLQVRACSTTLDLT